MGPVREAIGGGRSSRRGRQAPGDGLVQVAMLAESAWMVTWRPLGTVSRSVANPWSSTRMRIDSSDGSSEVVAANQTTVTPAAATPVTAIAVLSGPRGGR